MPDTCPECGGEMLDDEMVAWPYRDTVQRCAGDGCTYWTEETESGEIIGHAPNEAESPDSCEGGEG